MTLPTATSSEEFYQNLLDSTVNTLTKRGLVSPSVGVTKPPSATPIATAEDFMGAMDTILKDARVKKGGAAYDGFDTPVEDTYRQRRYDFISREEGVRDFAYDDKTGKRVTDPAAKQGNITIGVGYNMDRGDGKEMFSKLFPDLNYDEVYSGKARLNAAQTQRLFDQTIQEAEHHVAAKLQGVDLPEHQRLALVSMAFNNPSLIGPKLVDAIRRGDQEAAVNEILFNSNRSASRGLASRRYREAAMFMGPTNTAALPDFKGYMAKFA